MKRKCQLNNGGLSSLEALLLMVALAVVAAVVYRLTTRQETAETPSADPVQVASTRGGTAPDQGRVGGPPVASVRGASATASADPDVEDHRRGSRTPPVPPGLGEADFRLPSAQGRKGRGQVSKATEAFLDDDLTIDEDELGDEEVITALDLFRDMVGDETVSLGDKKELIGELGVDDIYETLDLIGEMEWGPDAEALFGSLMARWGKLDPARAMEYAADLDSQRVKQSAMSQVLKSWSREDPRAAFAWFSGLPEEDIRVLGGGARTLFKGMAAEDAMWALDQTWSLPSRSLKTRALQTVLGALTDQGYEPAALVSLYQGMPDGTDRDLLAQTIVDQWTRYQPADAARWIDTLTDEGSYTRAVDRLVAQWGKDDPASASDWVEDLGDPALRRVQMGRLVRSWVRTDPSAAAAWLNTFPPSANLDPAIHSLARGVMVDDPVSAWDWAAIVSADGARNRLLQQVGREWMKQDPANASAGITSSALPPNIKNKLLN